jgi:nitroimidazol reductase NimA-like FMN-containing flavoprotein (pyridoxamine 5'-phosphate oxidase superfamily)
MVADPAGQASRIIHAIQYATVATVSPGGTGIPWATPVFTAFDADCDFFWISDRHSVHSVNIRGNPEVGLVLFDSTVAEGTGAGAGVYVQALARELSEPEEARRAQECLTARAGRPVHPVPGRSGDSPARFYLARPSRMWINDSLLRDGVRVDGRTEVDLDALRQIERAAARP